MKGESNNLSFDSRLLSPTQKREIMWNIIEPGDPYDIRKSMIAKLPGRKNFMGQHLELVCLLQAAEIERLCQFLDQYKLRYRQISRIELDRHSYEVQIKQLTQQLSDEGSFKIQNAKLKQFLRKQSNELDELRKKGVSFGGYESDLIKRYQDSLKEIEFLRQENQSFKANHLKIVFEMQQVTAKTNAIENAKNREIQELKARFVLDSSKMSNFSQNESYQKLEIEYKKIEFELRRTRELSESKNKEIQDLQKKLKQVYYQLEEEKAQNMKLSSYSVTIKQYENKFNVFGQELERLNLVLRDKAGELNDLHNKYRISEDQNHRKTDYINSLEQRRLKMEDNYRELDQKFRDVLNKTSQFQDSKHILKSYQINLQKLSAEIQRLNAVLKKKVNENDELRKKLGEYEYQLNKIQFLKKENDELRVKFSEYIKKVSEYEGKIALFSQEIERLNGILRRKISEIEGLENKSKNYDLQIEDYQRKIFNLEAEYNIKIGSISNYDARINQISQENDELKRLLRDNSSLAQQYQNCKRRVQDYQNRLVQLSSEIERLTNALRVKSEDINTVEIRYRSTIQENQELKRKADRSDITDQFNSKLSTYQNTIALLKQEIQRLNEVMRVKLDESSFYEKKVFESQTTIRRYTQENQNIIRRLQQYEISLPRCSQEIERLNNVLQSQAHEYDILETKYKSLEREAFEGMSSAGKDYESRSSKLSQEIERLNLVLRSKIEEYASLEGRARSLEADFDTYRRKSGDIENTLREYESKGRYYEQNIATLSQENEDLKKRLKEIPDLLRAKAQYQSKIPALIQEIERLNALLRKSTQESSLLNSKIAEYDVLRSTIINLEERFSRSSNQNDDLRKKLLETGDVSRKSKEQESQLRLKNQENEQNIRKLLEYEERLNQLFQEIERLNGLLRINSGETSSFESKWKTSLQENDHLNQKNAQISAIRAQLENKTAVLSQEIERLNIILQKKVEDIKSYQNKFRNYQSESDAFKKRIFELEHAIGNELQGKLISLSQQNEELKFRLKQVTSQNLKIPDYENKLTRYVEEIQRLNDILKAKLEELNAADGRARQLEFELENLKRKFADYESSVNRDVKNQSTNYQQRFTSLSQENEELRKRATQSNFKLSEYQNKIISLSREIERAGDLLQKSSKESQVLNSKIIEFQSLKVYVSQIDDRYKSSAQENDELRRRLNQIGDLSRIKNQLDSRVRLLSQENEQINRRNQQFQARFGQLSQELERLNGVLRNKVQQMNNLESKLRASFQENQTLNKRLKEVAEINRKISEYENKIAITSQEIQRLNGILRVKIDENQSVENKCRNYEREGENNKRKILEMDNFISQLRNNNGLLEQKLSSSNAEAEDLRKKFRQLSPKLGEYENKIITLSQEIQRLNQNLKIKLEELARIDSSFYNYKGEAETRVNHLNHELDILQQKNRQHLSSQSSRIGEYESKGILMSQEIERLNYILKEHSYEIETQQRKQSQFIAEIERLNNTLRLKVEQTARWEVANNQLRVSIRSYQENLNLLNSEYEKLKSAYHTLNDEYSKSKRHLAEYEQSIKKLYEEFERLQRIMQELKKQNYDLKLQVQEGGNLIEKNRMLSQEIDRLLEIIETQKEDLAEVRLRLSDDVALQKRVSEHMALMVILFAQIESLRKRVKDKEKQCDDVRRSSLAPFKV